MDWDPQPMSTAEQAAAGVFSLCSEKRYAFFMFTAEQATAGVFPLQNNTTCLFSERRVWVKN